MLKALSLCARGTLQAPEWMRNAVAFRSIQDKLPGLCMYPSPHLLCKVKCRQDALSSLRLDPPAGGGGGSSSSSSSRSGHNSGCGARPGRHAALLAWLSVCVCLIKVTRSCWGVVLESVTLLGYCEHQLPPVQTSSRSLPFLYCCKHFCCCRDPPVMHQGVAASTLDVGLPAAAGAALLAAAGRAT